MMGHMETRAEKQIERIFHFVSVSESLNDRDDLYDWMMDYYGFQSANDLSTIFDRVELLNVDILAARLLDREVDGDAHIGAVRSTLEELRAHAGVTILSKLDVVTDVTVESEEDDDERDG